MLYVPDGTGGDGSESVLAADRVALQLPKDRGFDPDWARKLQLDKRRLRYFSGTEMARLLGFPGSFSFPDHVSLRQQWKLMGNSLNVAVAAKVVEVGLTQVWDRDSPRDKDHVFERGLMSIQRCVYDSFVARSKKDVNEI